MINYLKKKKLKRNMFNKKGYSGDLVDARILLVIMILLILWLVWKAFFS